MKNACYSFARFVVLLPIFGLVSVAQGTESECEKLIANFLVFQGKATDRLSVRNFSFVDQVAKTKAKMDQDSNGLVDQFELDLQMQKLDSDLGKAWANVKDPEYNQSEEMGERTFQTWAELFRAKTKLKEQVQAHTEGRPTVSLKEAYREIQDQHLVSAMDRDLILELLPSKGENLVESFLAMRMDKLNVEQLEGNDKGYRLSIEEKSSEDSEASESILATLAKMAEVYGGLGVEDWRGRTQSFSFRSYIELSKENSIVPNLKTKHMYPCRIEIEVNSDDIYRLEVEILI